MSGDQQQLEALLEQAQQPSTIKQAEKALRDASESPKFFVTLLQILFNEGSTESIRQLAAIQARKHVEQNWAELDESHKPEIRSKLLEFNLTNQPKKLLHSSAEIICAIAEVDSEVEGAWKELPDHLVEAASEGNAAQREIAIYISYLLLLNAPEVMSPAVGKLIPVLKAALQDPESADVRVNALLAFGEIASNVDSESEEEVKIIQDSVPAMIAILKDAVASGDEERAVKCFEMFQQTMVLAAIFFNTHFKDIIDFMLQVMVEDSIDVELRLQAIYFLIAAVNARKMKVQALKLGEELALHALRLVVDIDKFDDDGERNPGRQSLVLLDVLSENLPPNHVVLPLMSKVGEMSKNSEPTVRRAGILALSVCVEGAPDFFSTQLKELVPLILHLLDDDSPIVRGAALQAVARLAEELQDEVAVLHDSLIPAILKNFDAGEEGLASAASKDAHKIVLDSCIALEAFMDVLEKENTLIYIQEILPRLSRMLQQDDDKIKMVSVAAIGALAHSAEEHFLPYFKDCMQGLGALLQEKEDEDKLRLRQTATDAIGKIALAVGPTEFEPYVQKLMQVSEEALNLKDSDLRESSYILWSHLAKVYGENFEPFIEGVVKGLTSTLEQEENMISDQAFSEIMTKIQAARTENDGDGLNDEIEEILKSSKAAKILVKDDNVEDSDEDGDAMDDDSDDDSDGPSTALGLEKEVALEVLGDVFTHTKSKFLPYFEDAIKLVVTQLDHHSYSVRQAALGTLWRAYATIWQIENENFKASSSGGDFITSDKLKQLAALAMRHSLEAWDEENERSVITDVQRNVGETLDLCGQDVFVNQEDIPKVCKYLLAVIQAKHPCQQDDDLEEDEEEAGQYSEYDWLVIETAMDCVVSIAKVLGPLFAEAWPRFEKAMLKHVSSQEANERASATGTIAEIVRAMQGAATPYTESLLKVAIHRMGDEDVVAKANAIYAAGLLCQYSENTQFILSQYPTILLKLEPQLSNTESPHLLDNAAGCVARMILAHPDQVPLEDVIPVLLNLAPAKEDWEVNGPLFQCIVKLCQTRNPIIEKHIPQVAVAVKDILSQPEDHLDDETRNQVNQLAEFLQSVG